MLYRLKSTAISTLILFYVFSFISSFGSFSQNHDDIKQIMAHVKSTTDKINTLSAKMKQRKISSFMEKETVSKADFYYKKSGQYVIAPNKDEDNKYNITPNDIWIINKKNKTITVTTEKDIDLSQYFMGFGESQNVLETVFEMKLEPVQKLSKFSSYKILMFPLKTSKLYGKMDKIIMYIRDDLWLPFGAELYEADGDITIWEFSGIKINGKIKDEVFKREVPKGFSFKKLEKSGS
jgi:outer membrane lipoprotein-sorting protein